MADALHIDDPKAAVLARELAERTGESVNDAVVHALEERLKRKPVRRPENAAEREARKARILEILRRMDAIPVIDLRSPDDLLGYDERGLPR
jgi:antitoxin VapB